MNIHLTPEETFELQALAIRFGATPKQILERFVADLTGSLRTSGSDERRAEDYVKRAFFDRRADYCPEYDRLSEKEELKIQRLYEKAWLARRSATAAFELKSSQMPRAYHPTGSSQPPAVVPQLISGVTTK